MDIYTVFRELSGLDSILQAGGRCNREGKRDQAKMYIFELNDGGTKFQDIKDDITEGILNKYDDISCQQSIKEYYERLFFVKKDIIEEKVITKGCSRISDIPFAEYASDFEVVETRTVPLVIPRDEKSRKLVDSLKYTGGGLGISRQLQKYTCSVQQQELDDLIRQHVIDDFGTGVFCLINDDYYDKNIGVTFESKDYFLE